MTKIEELENEYQTLLSKKLEELKKEEDTKARLAQEQQMKQNYIALVEQVKKDIGFKAESKIADDKTGIALTGNALVDQTRRSFILRRQREGKKYEGETYEQMLKKRVDGDF